ncbi:MAG TPA: hypothetical protein VMK84_22725, partial [Streptosporangiaceae bacterium]|nr:hypothetical protein [Streptosporangiaceae bacterium]
EKSTGWRYSIIVTNIPVTGIAGVPGSHHPQFIDVLHREHAVVEDRVLPRGSARLLHDVALARHVPGSATDLRGCGARGW